MCAILQLVLAPLNPIPICLLYLVYFAVHHKSTRTNLESELQVCEINVKYR